MSCGLTQSGINKRAEAGELHRVHRGVYALGRPDLSAQGRWMAAVLACGSNASLSFAKAAALHEVRQSESTITDVTVPAGRPLPCHEGVRAHRAALEPRDVTVIDGIPVTSLARTFLDLACVVGDEALERAMNQAVILKSFDTRAIEDLLRRSKGRRGVRRLRRVLERGDLSGENVPKSGLEVRYAALCAAAGLPKPEINRYLLLGDEYHQVDFLWRKERVVVETDGGPYHQTGWQRARDDHRDRLLTAYGFGHARVPDDLVENDPAAAVRVACDLLAASSSRRESTFSRPAASSRRESTSSRLASPSSRRESKNRS